MTSPGAGRTPPVGTPVWGSKNDHTVRYCLGRSASAVAAYTYDQLPAAVRRLPSVGDRLAAALDEALPGDADPEN